MNDLVLYIAKQLVTKPDEVSIEELADERGLNLVLHVSPDDMGIIIGKSGQTIKAIRKLLLIKAVSENSRVNLQIYDQNPKVDQEAEEDNKTE